MSMLAERKRKQKWSLNPRGKTWSSDANKFGQKMLEKMGWQHGKGLGANEDGITENIKVSYKNDSQGMGYKESNEQWTEHESNFSALLESLSGELKNPEDIKVNSLEEKSQTSRARVHYHKFTRGKDLSRYSEKDLANIFGKRHLKETKNTDHVEDVQAEEKSDTNGSNFLFNAGSMKDYFKKKLSNFGNTNGYVIGNNGVLKKDDSESDTEFRPGFGFGFKPEQPKNENELENTKNKSTFVSYVAEETIKRKGEHLEDNIFSPKKKVRKDKSKENEVQGLSNPAFNPMSTPIKMTKHVLDTIEENEFLESSENSVNQLDNNSISYKENYKTKKRKIKNMEIDHMVRENEANDVGNLMNEESQVPNQNSEDFQLKKKKKNKKVKSADDMGISNPIFQSTVENDTTTENNNILEIKIKKKKKNKQIVDMDNGGGISNPLFNGNEIDETNLTPENPYEVKNGKKKKINEVIEETNAVYSDIEVTRKKKNKKGAKEDDISSLGLSNPVFEENVGNSTLESSLSEAESYVNSYEVKVKRKKDKKPKENTNFSIENPNFTECDISNPAIEAEENPYEVKRKEKKNKKAKKEIEDSNTSISSNLVDNNTNDDKSILESSQSEAESYVNSYEVKVKSKKDKKPKENTNFSIENPNFTEYAISKPAIEAEENPYEVKRKEKKNKKAKKEIEDSNTNVSSNLVDNNTNDVNLNMLPNEDDSIGIDSCDLMLNVVSEPVLPKQVKIEQVRGVGKIQNTKRRKSVRFSDVTQELIIPNNEELKMMESESGIDNANFDSIRTHVDENLETISKQLDMYQAEIENDINEQKQTNLKEIMIGEVGNLHGENEKLPDGTRLKLKYANFDSRTPFYQLNKTGAKKSYKHLIKGDIVVKFKNTNLHEIKGYAVVNRKKQT